ncbi:MAG TPA: hypothetical protein EYP67_07745 [Methanosarcinales archaeon]|nr:hypothetical protein [Methanosarcinales archaeon]
MRLGDIIEVSSADRYIAKLADEEVGFIGQFVSIPTKDSVIIGVIDEIAHSVREEMLGFLSPDKKIKYQPYIEDYKNSYAIIRGLGRLSDEGDETDRCTIDKPPHIDDPVESASNDEIARFHTVHGRPGAPYLRAMQDLLDVPVIVSMTKQIEAAVPESGDMLHLVRRYVKRT